MKKGYNFIKVTNNDNKLKRASNISIVKFLKSIKEKKLDNKLYQVDGIDNFLKEDQSEDICRQIFSEYSDYIINNLVIVRFDINEDITNWNNVVGFNFSDRQVNMKEIFGTSFKRLDTSHWCSNFNVDS